MEASPTPYSGFGYVGLPSRHIRSVAGKVVPKPSLDRSVQSDFADVV